MIFFKLANGWIYGEIYSDSSKVQPLMKPYKLLSEKVRCLPFFSFFVIYFCFEIVSLLCDLLKCFLYICFFKNLYFKVAIFNFNIFCLFSIPISISI